MNIFKLINIQNIYKITIALENHLQLNNFKYKAFISRKIITTAIHEI